MKLRLSIVVAALAAGAVWTGGADAAPTAVRIEMKGAFAARPFAGTFTASAPLCSTGQFTDSPGGLLRVDVTFTCADGSGSFGISSQERWKIRAGFGTGRYADLRGAGSEQLLPPTDDGTLVRIYEGAVDFDAAAPTASIPPVRVSRTGRSAYLLRMSFVAVDNVPENAVSFTARITAGGRRLAARAGQVSGGRVSLSVRLRTSQRVVTVSVVFADPLGNARTVNRNVRLRR